MPDVMAIVSKAIFEKQARVGGRLPGPGQVWPVASYNSKNKRLEPLAGGGRLFLATVRPGEALWLVGILEQPSFDGERWVAEQPNREPVRDIGAVRDRLRFDTGTGITAEPGKLGMSLQTPRVLTTEDAALLAGRPEESPTKKAPAPAKKKAPPKKASAKKALEKKKAPAKKKASAKEKAPANKKRGGAEKAPSAKAGDLRTGGQRHLFGADPAPPGRPAEILARLLRLWVEARQEEVAELIAAFGRAHEPASVGELREPVPQQQWLEAAARLDIVERGALLASLTTNATADEMVGRLEALERWDPDPRVAAALHEVVRQTPWISSGSRKVWTRVFRLLTAIGDPRTVAVARAFDPANIRSSWSGPGGPGEWMAERLAKVAAKIEALGPPRALSEAETAALAALRSALPRQAPKPASATAEEQLSYFLEHPDDLGACLVLADALQEAGDPRGELILLQHLDETTGLTREQRRREKELLKQHRDRLLGPLARVLTKGNLVFKRGFVHACEVKPQAHAHQLDAVRGHPLLATIHTLSAATRFAVDPGLLGLRRLVLTDDDQAEVIAFLRGDTELPLEALTLEIGEDDDEPVGDTPEALAALDGCRCLPALNELWLECRGDAGIVDATRTGLARRVTRLGLRAAPAAEVAHHAARILGDAGARVVTVCRFVDQGYEHRGYGDWESHLSVQRAAGAKELEVSVELALPPPGWSHASAESLEDLTALLGGFAGLPVASLSVRLLKRVAAELRSGLDDALERGLGQAGIDPGRVVYAG